MGGAMDPRVKQSFEFPGYVSKPQRTYTPYHTKALNALRKATPNISKSLKTGLRNIRVLVLEICFNLLFLLITLNKS